MAFIFPFHDRFNSVIYQTKILRKIPKILQILRNPESKILVGFYRFSWGLNHSMKQIPCHITHYSMNRQSDAMLRSTEDHHVLP